MSRKTRFEIVYEDKEVLVVYKERNLLTIRTNDPKTFSKNLYHYVHDYLRSRHERPFIVHRLDFETSGLVVFAKTFAVKERLQSCFEARRVIRLYEAVVRQYVAIGKKKMVRLFLSENKNSFFVHKDAKGKESLTLFEARNPIGIGTALKVEILTGRKNQIRVALHDQGLTLIGDERYSKDKAKRMYLNAYYLLFPEESGLKQREFFMEPLWIREKLPVCRLYGEK